MLKRVRDWFGRSVLRDLGGRVGPGERAGGVMAGAYKHSEAPEPTQAAQFGLISPRFKG